MFLVTVILFLSVMGENDFNNALNSLNSALQAQTSYLNQQNFIQSEKDLSDEEKAWSEKMMDKQNEWSLNMWNKTNEYNSPSAQLQRLQEAGLNPLYFGLDGSSANGLESAQALGYERASMKGFNNPGQQSLENKIALKSLDKDIALKDAQIDKLREEQSGIKLDNEFKDKTMNARAEGVELANSLSKEQMNEIRSNIKVNEQEIKKKIAETDSEIERKGLILAEKTLKQAQEKEIIELLPQKKLLLEAQTEAQKAAASASYMHALYEKGLIESGYIDKMCEDLEASIKQKQSQADANEVLRLINEWKLSVRNGGLFDLDSIDNLPAHIIAGATNVLFSFVSSASEAVGGGLSGFFK